MVRQTLNQFKKYIEKAQDFVFTKFGDGETICMDMRFDAGAKNCDNQSYSINLGNKLIESAKFLSNKENVFIGEWVGDIYEEKLKKLLAKNEVNFQYVPYETLLNIENAPFDELKLFYKAIKDSNRKKIYICPAKLNAASKLFNCDILNVPENEAFSYYDTIKRLSLQDDHTIFLYSAGLLSKVLICDILEKRPNTTHIDIGSGLDNLYVGTTRALQLPKEKLIEIYADIENSDGWRGKSTFYND